MMKFSSFKSINRKVSMATVALMTIVSLSSAVTAFADTNVPDSSTTREITIHALQGTPTANKPGFVNDGTEQNVTGTPLQHVTFTATLVTPTGSAANMKVGDTSTYTTTSTVVSGETDTNGTVSLNITEDGYYLLHQVTTVGGVASMQDSIVQVPLNSSSSQAVNGWLYDINVYPKTDLSQDNAVNKTVEIGDNVLDDNTGTNKQATVFAGQDITWNLASAFSDSMVTDDGKVGSFELTDALNSNLTFKAINFVVGTKEISLDSTTDYTLTTTDGNIDLKLTETGIKAIKAAKESSSDQFIVNLTTTVSNTYKYGQIGNYFTTSVKNAYGVDLSNTTGSGNTNLHINLLGSSDSTTDVPEVYLGALRIQKIDSVSKTPLSGATFKLIKASSKDEAQALVDGKTSTATYVQNPSQAGQDYSLTTGTDGMIEFDGLELTDTAEQTGDTSTANTHYYVIETAAPTGYDLPTSVVEVVASIDPTTTQVGVSNNLDGGNIKLPFTGGQGMIGIIVIAGVATTASIVIRRRKTITDKSE
ncbi:SpaH/EbpB family LPXTG-anchored major pilin [Lactococcus allomyrinae]|uniref:Uncharacterized protein n=1 Tax=Lactococcus allomyrinae TaxID=2419773 RepID=A0A387BBX1_9LACT|nr:SpaH/EbpB family LPXTG-anchored major pilin [Lactococcus allomyrinae]AYF99927.1 hypothetical protein D7I46_01785 [Lactococcus allomyrinae]